MGIQADYVGRTPAEYAGKKEFEFKITMTGEIVICAKTWEEALEIVEGIPTTELVDYIEDIKFE